jgi:hypothetical protein
VNLLRYCGYKNFADQLSHRWLELGEVQAPRNCCDESTVSPGGREEEPTNEIDLAPSTDIQLARIGAVEGGNAVICRTALSSELTSGQCANGKSHRFAH